MVLGGSLLACVCFPLIGDVYGLYLSFWWVVFVDLTLRIYWLDGGFCRVLGLITCLGLCIMF